METELVLQLDTDIPEHRIVFDWIKSYAPEVQSQVIIAILLEDIVQDVTGETTQPSDNETLTRIEQKINEIYDIIKSNPLPQPEPEQPRLDFSQYTGQLEKFKDAINERNGLSPTPND